MNNFKIDVLEKKLSLDNVDIESIFSQNYIYDEKGMVGEFYLNIEDKDYEHSVIMSSRFNDENKDSEQYTGWFIQLIQNELSLVVGNGKQWVNIVSNANIKKNIFYHVYFNVSDTKCELYVDGCHNFKENISFIKACDHLVIGALNTNEDFRFYGEVKKLVLGNILQVDKIEDSNSEDVCDFNLYINNVNNNMNKLNVHVSILNEMKEKIIKWNLKGLSYDISILQNLEKQIENYKNNKTEFVNNINNFLEKIFDENEIVKKTNRTINDSNIIVKYGKILNNYVKIIKLCENSKDVINRYQLLSIDVGDSLDTIEEQKNKVNVCFENSIDFLIKLNEDSFNLNNINII